MTTTAKGRVQTWCSHVKVTVCIGLDVVGSDVVNKA